MAFQLIEVSGDLFSSDDEALAHCVSRDLRMGKGIAVEFKNRFQRVDQLRMQESQIGQVAYLQLHRPDHPHQTHHPHSFIFYLITKEKYSDKPTFESLEHSLENLRLLCERYEITRLSIPRLGCGLDRLLWKSGESGGSSPRSVFSLIVKVFSGSDVKVTVYSL